MTEVLGKATAAGGAGLLAVLTELPTAVVVCLIVGGLLLPYALAWEQTRREAVGWRGATEVYRAGGDGAAVARGLRGQDPEPEDVDRGTPTTVASANDEPATPDRTA